MNKTIRTIAYVTALSTLTLLTGCTKQEKTGSGVLIGAGTGALIGGLAGGPGGAVAGGVIGGAGGGIIGHSMGDDE